MKVKPMYKVEMEKYSKIVNTTAMTVAQIAEYTAMGYTITNIEEL